MNPNFNYNQFWLHWLWWLGNTDYGFILRGQPLLWGHLGSGEDQGRTGGTNFHLGSRMGFRKNGQAFHVLDESSLDIGTLQEEGKRHASLGLKCTRKSSDTCLSISCCIILFMVAFQRVMSSSMFLTGWLRTSSVRGTTVFRRLPMINGRQLEVTRVFSYCKIQTRTGLKQ